MSVIAIQDVSAAGGLTLPELAAKINIAHQQCETAVNAGLQHALEAGRLLVKAKETCGHGAFSAWLVDNFHGSLRTARAYMLVANRWPTLDSKWQRAATLSCRQAIRLLTVSDDAPKREEGISEQTDESPPLSIDEIFSLAQAYGEDLLRRWDAFREHAVRVYRRRLAACKNVEDLLAADAHPETKSIRRHRQRLERKIDRFGRRRETMLKALRNRLSELQAAEVPA